MKIKNRVLPVLLAVAMALACIQGWAMASPGEPAEGEPIEAAFTDKAFLAAVRELIGKTDGEHIYKSDVESMIELDVNRYEKKQKVESLDGIEHFTGLEKLDCSGNKLVALDLSHNPNLKDVQCWDNDLVTLDVSHNPKLEILDCSFNYLTSLDVSNCPELKWLDCNCTELQELDVSQNTRLTTLSCYETELKTLDISSNIWLEELDLWGGHLVNLDVSNNTKLKYLTLQYHDMCAVDSVKGLENCPGLVAEDTFFFEPQNGPTGQHTFETVWAADGTSHWHTCSICGAEGEREGHIYDDDRDAGCDACGYERTVAPPETPAPSAPPAPPETPAPPTLSVSGGSSYSYYTITASAGEGGKIKPGGRVSVRENRDKTFTITPGQGYEIADVLVDGKSVGAVTEYSFEKASKDHTIEAVFREVEAGQTPCPRDESCPIWPYTDADAGEWYHDGVHYCIENGLMAGYGGGRFLPDAPLTRGMLVQILYNEAGRPALSEDSPFDDVASGAWYADAVTWCAEKRIVEGHGKGRFGPEEPITREQLAVMLYRRAGSPGHRDTPLPFDDGESVSGYALDALGWAVENGIIEGEGRGLLSPKDGATRAQAAAMLQRYLSM